MQIVSQIARLCSWLLMFSLLVGNSLPANARVHLSNETPNSHSLETESSSNITTKKATTTVTEVCPAGPIDFEFDTEGNSLSSGTWIDEQWSDWGIHIHGKGRNGRPNQVITFDTSEPTGGDWDLGTPNETFGGPGVGTDGEVGKPGANEEPQGNVLILADNLSGGNPVRDPNDSAKGGDIHFEFDYPYNVASVMMLDMDGQETDNYVKVFDPDGGLIKRVNFQPLGDNSYQNARIDETNVGELHFFLRGSGAISTIVFCEEDTSTPTPVPSTPEPYEEPEFPACPANTEQLGTLADMLRRDRSPKTHNYQFNVPFDSQITVLGHVKEGHPERGCPGGRNCGQGQMYEEFNVAVNDEVIGEYLDKGNVDDWFSVGPWVTQAIVPSGKVDIVTAHLLEGSGAQSVDYKLTVCAEPIDTPTPTQAPTASPTPIPPESVHPITECIVNNGNGSYTAFFGYKNENNAAVDIPVGADNSFSPSPQNRGQPTTFQPGRTSYWPEAAFSVDFDGSPLVWSLNGRTATASSNGTPCSYHVFFEKTWYDDEGKLLDAPPVDLPSDYSITARSELGTATCSYPNGSSELACEYSNQRPPALDNKGLWVPIGEEYIVNETGLPTGWEAKSGVGIFTAGDGYCENGRDGFIKNCTHTVKNQAVVQPTNTPEPPTATNTPTTVPTTTTNTPEPSVCVASLGPAADFNVFMLGDVTQSSSDTEGRMAAAGDVSLGGYSVADKLDPSIWTDQDVLVVGGNLTYTSGRVYYGNAIYGGNADVSGSTTIDGTLSQGTPIDFAAAENDLLDRSATLSQISANGTTQVQYWGGPTAQVTLTGTDPDLNVFTVSGTDLSNTNTLRINAPAGSTVVINIDGTVNQMKNFGIFLEGINRRNVLYNFYETTDLTLQGIGIEGSVLAPQADINFPHGVIYGTLIGASLEGIGQSNHEPFEGCGDIPPTPTNTPLPTEEPTLASTEVPTSTPVPPTNTPTNTPIPPTNTPTEVPTATNTPSPICIPDAARDLTGSIRVDYEQGIAIGTVINSSQECEYEVGMASYQKFDEILSNQVLYDSMPESPPIFNDGIIAGPGETLLQVELPLCATQIDLFFKSSDEQVPLVLPAFHTNQYGPNGNKYGPRLLAAKHIGGTTY
ncbi:MAG: choice-of-anchor A family protein [Chloroflexota bacterium]